MKEVDLEKGLEEPGKSRRDPYEVDLFGSEEPDAILDNTPTSRTQLCPRCGRPVCSDCSE